MPEFQKRYYVTTPIYYVNGVPHVGTATTTVLADTTARFRQLRGESAFWLTGTDEHAQKVADAAAAAGTDPQSFVDGVSQRYVETWRFLGCHYSNFIRTSEERHKKVVREVYSRLSKQSDIYLGTYEGWYSVSDETFFRDSDVDEHGFVKETGAKVERIQEEVHYFRLSAYGDRLRTYILENPEFLLPETRKNEVLAFIENGLRDIAISRKNSGWGIPVPGDESKVFYVWFDALINYLSATGWPDNPDFTDLWPADAHLMAKEIYVRFHATFWPAMLMGLGLPLPKHIVGHGWWTIGGEKGAKSKGNIPLPQDVTGWLQAAGAPDEPTAIDALRYYLLRDIRFTDDSEWSLEILATRCNADLGNDLGNVLNRVLAAKYFEGTIPRAPIDSRLASVAAEAVTGYEAALETFDWGAALQSAWTLARQVNVYLAEKAPWKAAKEGRAAEVAEAIYNALEGIRLVAYLASPAVPHLAQSVYAQLGLSAPGPWESESRFGFLPAGTKANAPLPLFPRLDTKKLLLAAKAMETTEEAPQAPAFAQKPEATFDDFDRIQLVIADVVTAERVENTDKLMKLGLRIADTERTIISGIANVYAPEDLIGRQIVLFANLQPKKLRGTLSQGMLLAASDENGDAILLMPDKPVKSGSGVK
jgi:methionyl-tRNA synthetase